jgi:hypothetical protein
MSASLTSQPLAQAYSLNPMSIPPSHHQQQQQQQGGWQQEQA